MSDEQLAQLRVGLASAKRENTKINPPAWLKTAGVE
jgi:hypothetical protein